MLYSLTMRTNKEGQRPTGALKSPTAPSRPDASTQPGAFKTNPQKFLLLRASPSPRLCVKLDSLKPKNIFSHQNSPRTESKLDNQPSRPGNERNPIGVLQSSGEFHRSFVESDQSPSESDSLLQITSLFPVDSSPGVIETDGMLRGGKVGRDVLGAPRRSPPLSYQPHRIYDHHF